MIMDQIWIVFRGMYEDRQAVRAFGSEEDAKAWVEYSTKICEELGVHHHLAIDVQPIPFGE